MQANRVNFVTTYVLKLTPRARTEDFQSLDGNLIQHVHYLKGFNEIFRV